MKRIYLVILLLFSFSAAWNQDFFKSYGTEGNDYASAVIALPDSGFIVVGATEGIGQGTTDGYLFKVDKNGNHLWSQTYGGPNVDWLTDVKITSYGFAVCGYSNSNGNGYDGYLARLNSDGEVISDTILAGQDWRFFNALDVDHNDNLFVVGQQYNAANGGTDGILMKWNAADSVDFLIELGGSDNDLLNDVMFTSDSNLLFCGVKTNVDEDFWVAKSDTFGNVLWEHELGDTLNDVANHVFELTPDRYVVTGASDDTSATGTDAIFSKIHENGFIEITNIINWVNTDYGIASLSYAGDSTFRVVLETNSHFLGGYDGSVFECGFYTFGSYGYNYDLGTNEDDFIQDADTTFDKGLIVLGETYATQYGVSNIFLHKFDSTVEATIPFEENLDLSTKPEIEHASWTVSYDHNNDLIAIYGKLDASFDVTLFDIQGRVLYSRIGQFQRQLELELIPGVYLVQIGKESKKLIVN